MVIYVPLSFVFSTLHKRSQENKQSQGSQLGVWVGGYEDHKLAGICCQSVGQILTWFMYYDDWLRELRFNSSNAHPTLKDCKFRWNAWDEVSHKLNVTYNLFSSFITFVFGVFFLFFFLREGIEGDDKW